MNNAESVGQFQPRVALWQPWEKRIPFLEGATLKELRRALVNRKAAQLLQGCEQTPRAFLNPGFQSKPWAGISQRFQRYSILARTHEFSTFGARPCRQKGQPIVNCFLLFVVCQRRKFRT